MKISDEQLNAMIQKSQYAKSVSTDDGHWYSFQNQKIHAFNLARDLVLAGEDIDDAIRTSKDFVDAFYVKAIKPHAWERN